MTGAATETPQLRYLAVRLQHVGLHSKRAFSFPLHYPRHPNSPTYYPINGPSYGKANGKRIGNYEFREMYSVQIAQCRTYLQTLGPNVGILCIFGCL